MCRGGLVCAAAVRLVSPVLLLLVLLVVASLGAASAASRQAASEAVSFVPQYRKWGSQAARDRGLSAALDRAPGGSESGSGSDPRPWSATPIEEGRGLVLVADGVRGHRNVQPEMQMFD
eukprot:366167-Chlamydomonas_euryale.AAC.15